jgi:hypothetical protein
LIIKLFYSYNQITNQANLEPLHRKGIPRGIGVSAYFAELYLRKVDFEIKKISDITFFARFVDDIIILISSENRSVKIDYISEIRKIVEPLGLTLKDGSILGEEKKTFQFDLSKNTEFNFLGYKYALHDGKYVNIFLTESKKDKYKKRISLTLDKYLNDCTYNSIQARQLMIHRLNYLTKNTRLFHPKIGLIGIYYSNSLIENDCPCLDELDLALSAIIDQKLPVEIYPELNSRLKRYSFKKGFVKKEFFNIESKRKKIPDSRSKTMMLKNNRLNNFERIISAWK